MGLFNAHACVQMLPAAAGRAKTGNLKGEEVGMVEQVAIVGTADPSLQRANILMRLNRNPVIGDKFSSRHGQKGVLSQQWPDTDMPFVAATGMRCTDQAPSQNLHHELFVRSSKQGHSAPMVYCGWLAAIQEWHDAVHAL